jgi:hypothetical protein
MFTPTTTDPPHSREDEPWNAVEARLRARLALRAQETPKPPRWLRWWRSHLESKGGKR